MTFLITTTSGNVRPDDIASHEVVKYKIEIYDDYRE